jgi:ferredoxin
MTMTLRVNPKLVDELEHFGADDVSKCYHCGNCSATCPFSERPFNFPRKSMRYLQMGLEERLKENLEPWLCYYCGECSDQCPREAEPGETMMAMRRWLTSKYDITGLSKLFYRSWKWELFAVLFVAVLTGAGFLAAGLFWGGGDINHYDAPNAFLPSSGVHIFDWFMAAVLTFFLVVNSARMWWFTMMSPQSPKVSLFAYIKKAYLLPLHFFTQKRYSQCEKKRPWVLHLILMLSYATMFALIMFFLHDMQAGPEIRWQVHAFGYAAAIGLCATTAFAIRGRLKKIETFQKHSHESDWIFLILLFYVSVTGVLQHILHRTGLDAAANVTYIVHMMGVVPMLVLEVPFSKWAHLAFRPLAMYFSGMQAEALLAREQQKHPAGEALPVAA